MVGAMQQQLHTTIRNRKGNPKGFPSMFSLGQLPKESVNREEL